MSDTKPLLKSKTAWGVIVAGFPTAVDATFAAAPAVGELLGYTITTADVDLAGSLIGQVMTGLGSLWALYGRIMATKPIG